MTDQIRECPFCGNKPQWRKTKKMQCQLHGDDYQYEIVGCFHPDCKFNPQMTGAYKETLAAAWNQRALPEDEKLVEVMAEAIFTKRWLDLNEAWEGATEKRRDVYRAEAKAALAAIRKYWGEV